MDNETSVREILESYDEITIKQEIIEGIYLISMFEKMFLFIAPFEDSPASTPVVYLYNDLGLDIPHIMLQEETFPKIDHLPEGKYRWVCLYENESSVNTIIPYEDKVIDAVDRLIELLSMNTIEKEREYQKEFMFYWNSRSKGHMDISVYLQQDSSYAEMDAYYGKKEIRVIEQGLILSDIDSREKKERIWVHHIENDLYFIPITDCREIIPPHRGYDWSYEDIKNIIYSRQIEHISNDTYQHIKTCIPKKKDIILVFGMKLNNSNIVFAVRLQCKNISGHTLLEKILNDIVSVESLHTSQKDYTHLCNLIGNDIGLLGRRVLLIGAGSLGSYVAFELIKNGISHLKIYDGDHLDEENILRWAYGGIGKGSNKAKTLSFLLSLLHPEIEVEAVNTNIDEKALAIEADNTDLIIFTIGSSDEQLKFNRILKMNQCPIPTIYVWLEAGGNYSHILVANYKKHGCFECLYTDEAGKLTNNRARKNPDGISESVLIRNGCGGTRAAYGTAIILRTVAALLDTLKKIQLKKISESVLVDISPDSVGVSDTVFPMEVCNCCGNKE